MSKLLKAVLIILLISLLTACQTPQPVPTEPSELVQDVSFVTSDGVTLSGQFWPAAAENVPVVILLHQYNQDHRSEWPVIGAWLQNRGLLESMEAGKEGWLDASWFPEMPDDLRVAVFAFTFRNCEGGCKSSSVPDRSLWIEDAKAAISAAAGMEGVDPTRIVLIGTSIGADAAVDACRETMPMSSLRCMGALSFSPGSYLGIDYAGAASDLLEVGIPVMCAASENDLPSAAACQAVAQTGNDQSYVVPGDRHGIAFFDPDAPRRGPELMIEFLETVINP
ncbi:MAG: hypothetical protein JW750_09625 [Anaerolineaceae bacterium]|nr:hypothetical protein [Anaerolineaceae bacterium]